MWESRGERLGKAPVRHLLGNTYFLFQIGLAATVLLATGCSAFQHARSTPPAPQVDAEAVKASPPSITPPTPVPVRPKRPVVHEVKENKEPEKIASIDPKSLIGLQPAAVEKILGSPSTVAKAEPSLVWTYAGLGCSFQIVFYPDIKTEAFHALKYSSSPGEGADSICIRNILTVRSNGPS